MNYRHVYHAGNFADVFKHAVLMLIARHLRAKDKPSFLLDTHAGVGRYDLRSEEAQKTGEYRDGIGRLLNVPSLPPELTEYVATVAALNGVRQLSLKGLLVYPGSPRILRAAMGPVDRMVAVDLHPADANRLALEFSGDRQVTVHHMDGYRALKAFLPPVERRGMVIVDPPFEQTDDGVDESDDTDQHRQAHHRAGGTVFDDRVDGPAGQHGRGHAQHGRSRGEDEERDDRAQVRPGEGGNPPQRFTADGSTVLAVLLHRALERHPHADVGHVASLSSVRAVGSPALSPNVLVKADLKSRCFDRSVRHMDGGRWTPD